nr:hypothetical protein [Tanacetum cinerariifolium]
LIVFLFAIGQLRSAQADIRWLGPKLEAMAVQVIAFGGDELQLDGLRRGVDQVQLKGLADWQEVLAVVDGCAAQCGRGPTVQQARAEGG